VWALSLTALAIHWLFYASIHEFRRVCPRWWLL